MTFDQKINSLIDEAQVPESLLPENIALMLKAQTAEKETKPHAAISMKTKQRAIVMRTAAALAACIALTVGIIQFADHGATDPDAGIPTGGEEITGAANYTDVYKKIQDVYMKYSTVTDGYDVIANPHLNQQPTAVPAQIEKAADADSVVEYGVVSEQVEGVAEADIIKTNGKNLYYTANGYLYVISDDNGKMEVLSKIKRDGSSPFEMYLNGNRLMVLSNHITEVPYQASPAQSETTVMAESVAEATEGTTSEPAVTEETASSEATSEVTTTAETEAASAETTASETAGITSETPATAPETPTDVPKTIMQASVVVEIYDISEETPVLINTYKQSGAYTSSRMIDSYLYIVTNYSQYQTKPLEKDSDLDNYIPSYYLNDIKKYVEPQDIHIPSQIKSTGYSVIGGLNVQSEVPVVSVKAVLGSGRNVSCSSDSLYVVGNLWSNDSKDSSAVTKFTLSEGNVVYTANANVDGIVVNSFSMNEYDGCFRVGTVTAESADKRTYNIFVLDSEMKPVGSLTGIEADGTVKTVRFKKDTAYIVTDNAAPLAVSLADKANPKMQEAGESAQISAYLFKYSENRYIGIGNEISEDGTAMGLKLSMFDSTDPANIKEMFSTALEGNLTGKLSDNVINRKVLYLDSEKNIIGIPTSMESEYGLKNLYYVFEIGENGFTEKGVLEYNDIDNTAEFTRGLIIGDVYYAISDGRIVSAQLSDMKVIEAMPLK